MASENSSDHSSPRTAVFLVGFMGAGKTTVVRALGLRLNWLFEDLDERIERRERRTVAEIFRDSGESAFRRAEHEALRELIEELRGGSARIIALGGGAFVQEDNASLLRSSPVTAVFLDAPADELWARCQTQAHAGNNNAVKNNAVKNNKDQIERPLLKDRDQFHELYKARRKHYAQASFTIQTGGRDVESVAAEIEERLGLRQLAVRTEQGEVE